MRHETRPLRWLLLLLPAIVAGCTATPRRSEGNAAAGTSSAKAAETNVQLGQGYLEQGRLELAMQKLTRAIELDPRSTAAHTVIAVLYERIGNTDSARVHYKRAVELSPQTGDVLNNYAAFQCNHGEYVEADALFARALKDPFYKTPAVANSNRGSCAIAAGNLELADDSLRRAVMLAPDMPDALYSMARLSFMQGDFLRARAFLQRFDATGKPAADGLLLGYQVEQKLGNARAANEYRQRLLAQFPDSEAARHLDGNGSPP
jgi:type IV pilus assembly protein PilF